MQPLLVRPIGPVPPRPRKSNTTDTDSLERNLDGRDGIKDSVKQKSEEANQDFERKHSLDGKDPKKLLNGVKPRLGNAKGRYKTSDNNRKKRDLLPSSYRTKAEKQHREKFPSDSLVKSIYRYLVGEESSYKKVRSTKRPMDGGNTASSRKKLFSTVVANDR